MPTIVADSTDRDDFVAALNACADGDTLSVPAGDSTWSSGVTISKPIHIQGAGVGQTIIRHTGTGILAWSNNITTSIDGFEFFLDHVNNSAFVLTLRGRENKVSNCKFTGVSRKLVAVRATGGTNNPHPTGVVWNCTFISMRVIMQGDLASSTTQAFGRRIWADLDEVVGFGLSNTMFFEDCVFDTAGTKGNITDAEFGGRYVIRYCDITGGSIYNHGITSNGERGTRLVEAYNNTLHYEGNDAQDPPIRLRGGAAVIWGNTVTGGWTNWTPATVFIDNELLRYGDNIGDGNEPLPNGTGTHSAGTSGTVLTDSSKAWTPGAFVNFTVYNLTDGSLGRITANTETTVTVASLSGGAENQWESGDSYKITNGYPLRDMPGRGKDSEFWVWDQPGPAQELDPIYEWDNTRDGVPISGIVLGNNGGGWIQEGRDVISGTPKPGYAPYTYPHPLRGSPVAPTIISDPSSATRTVGQSVTFSVTASGNPAPTYQWRKAGVPISGATSSSYTIPSVQESDAADYDCVVTNSEGSDTSAVATLTVNDPTPPPTAPSGRRRRGAKLLTMIR
jgi:hypothetical protein